MEAAHLASASDAAVKSKVTTGILVRLLKPGKLNWVTRTLMVDGENWLLAHLTSI